MAVPLRMTLTGQPHVGGKRGALSTETLAGGVAILLVLTLFQRLVGFGRGILFCRSMDAQELGQWDLALSFLLLAGPVAVLSLPGSFGRYLEHYRGRGQLRAFLRRTAAVTAALALLAAGVIGVRMPWFSQLIFGRGDRTELVALLAVSLLAVVAFNFVTELFTALRWQRVASGLQALNTVSFTLLGAVLLFGWQAGAASIVVAYGGACLVSFAASLFWLCGAWHAAPAAAEALPQGRFWAKLLPFSLSVWFTNWLGNLFAMVDRYMIVHYGGMESAEALAQVGQYHAARLVPVLLVMVTAMLGALVLAHLSHDWEAGRRERVRAQLKLILKLLCFTLSAVGVLVLWCAPVLFGVLFEGRFSGGLVVLPWTLTACTWVAVASVARNYLWCAEKGWLASLAYLGGIVVNVALNLQLLPRFGLPGAVWSTAAGTLVALVLIYRFSRRQGMHLDLGTCLVSALPALFCLGPWATLAALAAVGALALCGTWILSPQEKGLLAGAGRTYATRIKALCQLLKTRAAVNRA